MNGEILILLSSAVLGIFLGAQITEAVLFVPYWKSLSPDDFFAHHQVQGKKIYQFFAPLTIAATFLPLFSIGYCFVVGNENHLLLSIFGFSTLAFFSTYFLFFKEANKRFADRAITNEALPNALKRWGNWHWGRICFECIAFGASLLLLV